MATSRQTADTARAHARTHAKRAPRHDRPQALEVVAHEAIQPVQHQHQHQRLLLQRYERRDHQGVETSLALGGRVGRLLQPGGQCGPEGPVALGQLQRERAGHVAQCLSFRGDAQRQTVGGLHG